MRTILRFLICVILIMKELLDQVYFLLGGIRMADDNILAGLGGFLGGIRDVYVPYALKDIEERRKKIPITRVEALSGIKTGLDPNELVTPDELGIIKSRIGAQSLKGLYDTEGNIVDYV